MKLRRYAPAALALALLWASPRAAAELLPVRTYTSADGLPHDRVKRIVQDGRGFLWFCTTGGLARFDGRSFVAYGVPDGLPFPSVNDLLETPGGAWVATNGGGIAFFDPVAPESSFRPVRVGDGAASRVNAIVEDARGTLWAATDGGLYRRERAPASAPTPFQPVPLGLAGRPDPSVQVSALLETPQGLLAGTRYGLVLVGPEGTRTIPLGAHVSPMVPALARAASGEILVGLRPGGLVRLEPGTFRVAGTIGAAEGLRDPTVSAVLVAGARWVLATDDGIAVVENGRLRTFSVENGLPDRAISALGADAEGNLWLGSPGWGGATQVDLSGSALFAEGDGIGRIVTAVWERPGGEVAAASSNWTISRYDGTSFRAIRPRLPAHVRAPDWRAYHGVLEDREGRVWIGTREGIYRFGPVRRLEELASLAPDLHLTTADGLATNEVSHLFEDRRGDVWIGTFPPVADPLRRWRHDTGKVETFAAAEGLPAHGTPYFFEEDAAGDIWIAYRDGPLVRWRGGRFETMSGKGGIPAETVAAMAVDGAGRLWASSWGAGLVRIDRPGDAAPTAVVYGARHGIRDFYLGRLLADSRGRILVGTARHLLAFDPVREAVTEARAARPASLAEPLAFLQDRAGVLWLGSWRGLARLVPEAGLPPAGLRMRISGASVSGTRLPVPATGEGRLELGELPAESNLSVSFLAIGRFGEPVLFEHWMEGIDDRWSSGHAEGVVHYGRLAGGSYRFRVRAAGEAGPASDEAVVSFSVRPPVWRRWWFLAGTALLLGGLGFALDLARTRRRRALEEVRSRIASDLHDDLGASLSRISILSEVAARTVREGRSPDELVGKIGDASRSVVEKLADGIWAVDPRRDDLRSLVERLRQAAHELVEPTGASWRVEVPEGAERIRLHPDRRRQVYLLLKEAIANAARHSGARSVTLAVSAARGRTRFVLHDDGCGFVPPEASGERFVGGRGLSNMRRRAGAIGGTLDIVTAPGEGTTLELEVPDAGGRPAAQSGAGKDGA